MFAIGRRRLKLAPEEIERLLYDHGLRKAEVQKLSSSSAGSSPPGSSGIEGLSIRALREVAKGDPDEDPMTEKVRAALISVGELKSKSIRRRIIRMFKRKGVEKRGSVIGGGKDLLGRTVFERPSILAEMEDIDDTADLEESSSDDSEDLNRMEAQLEGMEEDGSQDLVLPQNISYSAALNGDMRSMEAPRTQGESFWEMLGIIFCAAPAPVDEPTYTVTDIQESHVPLKQKVHKSKKKAPPRAVRRQTAPAAISTSTGESPLAAAASKISGHPQLLSTYRQMERDGKAFTIDVSNINEILETCVRDSLRVSRLYLCLDRLDGGHKFEWKLFSGKPGGLDLVYTSFPPGYGSSSQVAIRSETYVNANWKRVFDIMMTDARTASYDPNVNTFKQLRIDHEERIYARHYWFHAVWPTKARDFVMVTTWERLEDGAVLISTIGLPDCVSPRSDECVRAYVCSSSCLIRPGYSPKENGYRAPAVLSPPTSSSGKEERNDEGKEREKDDSWCHVTFCTHCDPGGGVPSFVTNMLGPSNSLQCLLSMRAIVEKEERDKQGKE